MEPLTYFSTSGGIIGAYMYYMWTNRKFSEEELHGSVYNASLEKRLSSAEFDKMRFERDMTRRDRLRNQLQELQSALADVPSPIKDVNSVNVVQDAAEIEKGTKEKE